MVQTPVAVAALCRYRTGAHAYANPSCRHKCTSNGAARIAAKQRALYRYDTCCTGMMHAAPVRVLSYRCMPHHIGTGYIISVQATSYRYRLHHTGTGYIIPVQTTSHRYRFHCKRRKNGRIGGAGGAGGRITGILSHFGDPVNSSCTVGSFDAGDATKETRDVGRHYRGARNPIDIAWGLYP